MVDVTVEVAMVDLIVEVAMVDAMVETAMVETAMVGLKSASRPTRTV